jgi:two-component system NtrC family sensor kinase
VVHEVDDDRLQVAAIVPGLAPGRDDALVRIDLQRTVMAQGRASMAWAVATTGLAAVMLFLVLGVLLQRVVVGPLTALTRHALTIRATGDLGRRSGVVRPDEIGTLASEFDRMVECLAGFQHERVRQARAGGMAEIARVVLHDIGNAMQAVSGNVETLRTQLGSRDFADLERVAGLLAEHAGDLERWLTADPKGRKVLPFLQALVASLGRQRGLMTTEVDQLRGGLDHIRSLVERQNENAGRTLPTEPLALGPLVAEAVRLGGVRESGVRVEIDEPVAATVAAEKHKLLAVLINVLRNAVHSSLQVPVDRRVIRIETRVAAGRVRLAVVDRGVGIRPEDLTRIFAGGYSTRPGGKGLGLHGCANSMSEIGGRLFAESEGVDRGASFVLELKAAADVLAAEPAGAAS